MLDNIISKVGKRDDGKRIHEIKEAYIAIPELHALTERPFFKAVLHKIDTKIKLNSSGSIFKTFFYSHKYRVYKLESNEELPIVLVNLDHVLFNWRINVKNGKTRAINSLSLLLAESINVQRPNTATVKVFNFNLDAHFCFRALRSTKLTVLASNRLRNLREVQDITSAFDAEINYLEGIWGCEQGIYLYSPLFNFHICVNSIHDFDTKADFLSQNYTESQTVTELISFINFDKAIPYIVYNLKQSEREDTLQQIFNLFEEQVVPENQIMAAYDFNVLKEMIPEYCSGSNGLLSFIWAVDKLVRETAPDNADQLRNISVVAKNKVKGSSRDDLAATDNDWTEIRKILISTSGSKNESFILAELNMAVQGRLSVREFFNKIRDLMMDLILVRTDGMTVAQAAAEEIVIKNLARQRFIDGLHTDLSTYTSSKAPATLSDALSVALEREKKEVPVSTVQQIENKSTVNSELVSLLHKLLSNKDEQGRKTTHPEQKLKPGLKCYNCGDSRHLIRNCPHPDKRQESNSQQKTEKFCSFHKTSSHSDENCRAKRPKKNQKYCDFHKFFGHSTDECKGKIQGQSKPESQAYMVNQQLQHPMQHPYQVASVNQQFWPQFQNPEGNNFNNFNNNNNQHQLQPQFHHMGQPLIHTQHLNTANHWSDPNNGALVQRGPHIQPHPPQHPPQGNIFHNNSFMHPQNQ